MSVRGIRRVPALDGIRGLAILAVLLFHGERISGGFLGVDLFFTLSGFLITTLLVGEWANRGSVDLREFWSRRARRLLPALLLALAMIGGLGLLLAPELAGQVRNEGLASLFYVANWHDIVAGQSYFELFAQRSPLEHMWSLAIEEQFYLVWPLVVLALLRLGGRSLKPLMATTIVLVGLSLAATLALFEGSVSAGRIYYGTDTRAASILIGALLALVLAQWGHVRRIGLRYLIEIVGVGSFAAILLAWLLLDGDSTFLYLGGFPLLAIAAAGVIAAAVHPSRGPLGRRLSFAPLCWLGVVSYGLYLIHWPVFVWLDEDRTGLKGWPLFGVQLAVSLVLAAASYAAIESPIRRGGLARARQLVVVPTAIVLVAAVLVTGSVDPPARPSAASALESELAAARAQADPLLPPVAPGEARPARILLAGDSVPQALGYSLTGIQEDLGVVILNRGETGCDGARSDGRLRWGHGQAQPESEACDDWEESWPGDVEQFQPDASVLMLGVMASADRRVDGEWLHPCEPEFAEWYRGEVEARLDLLEARGSTPVLVTSPYFVLEDQPPDADERIDCVNDIYRSIAAERKGAVLIDLFEHLCDDRGCVDQIDGVELRPDGAHFMDEGAEVVGSWIVSQILAAIAWDGGDEAGADPGVSGPVRQVVYAGDTNGDVLANSLAAEQQAYGVVVTNAAAEACDPALPAPHRWADGVPVDDPSCAEVSPRWQETVASVQPDAVILVLGVNATADHFLLGDWRHPCDPVFRATYHAGVAGAVSALGSTGAKVAVTTQPRFFDDQAPADLGVRLYCLNEVYRSVVASSPQAVLLDLAEFVCPGGSCGTLAESVELRPDGVHYLDAGRQRVNSWLLAQVFPD